VHITELGGEYYRFDEARQELRGERTGVRYAIGTRVRVQVSRVDLDGRKIDFRMVREGEGESLLARGRSGRRRVADGANGAREVDGADRADLELAAVREQDRAGKAAARAVSSAAKRGRKPASRR
jgi:ribonuclease R